MKEQRRPPLKHAHGAVVCLKLKDFMQFSNWVEFYPGPYLNVVVGPNGSGKSSLVNGIGLALGANTGVLGRASELYDYIRNGCNEATIEIELFNENERNHNFKIKRVITRPDDAEIQRRQDLKSKGRYRSSPDTDCRWWLDENPVKGKKILDFVKELNIQTDNLCQFLPQDKVHDFSKMDPKKLLIKTVEAIGNSQLRQDHESLKTLQKEVETCDGLLEKKENTLKMITDNVNAIEQDVVRFNKRKTMMDQIRLLALKVAWNQVSEKKLVLEDEIRQANDQRRLVKNSEAQLQPKRKQLDAMKNERQTLEIKISDLKQEKKKLVNEASRITKRKEEIPDDIENLNVDYLHLVEREKDAEEVMKKLQKQVEELQFQYENARNDGQNQGLEQELFQIQREMKSLSGQQRDYEAQLRQNNYEQKSLEQEILHDRRQLDQIGNVAKQKRETLQRCLPNGQDAIKAMDWLKDNRDQFRGRIYDPLLMGIDVKDASQNAKYLENIINSRDLVAFAAENAEDMNKLMHQFRQVMKLRVNVVQVDPHGDPERLRCRSGQVQVPGFKSYAKDMFDCPQAIKHYLCKQYNLQNIPIFNGNAETHLNDLIQDFQLFFTGDNRHSVVKSNYSGQISTSSSGIRGRNWLQTSVDKTRINQLEKSIKQSLMKQQELKVSMEELRHDEQSLVQNLEVKRKEAKNIKEKMDMKKVIQGKLQALKMKMERQKNENKPLDLAQERNKMETAKEKFIQEDVGLAVKITENLAQTFNVRQSIDLMTSNLEVHVKAEQKKRNAIQEEQDELNKMKEKLGEIMENQRQAQEKYMSQLKVAQKAAGGDEYNGSAPPREVIEKWTEHHFQNISNTEATARQYELEGQLEYMDDVNDDVEVRYQDLRASKEQLETEVTRLHSDIEQKSKQIQDIRSSWVVQLEMLVEQINEKFSTYFRHMGYCGEIELNKGQHEHDFANYGIEIKVKFRDKYQLQRLDPYKQSGGERSVSTALYMMAMQTLTAVPFRCVDEINQGMDETNERKVFDLLIETSVRNQTGGAQYFLLTPKLLHDLHFERGVNVHHVHNGSKMGFGKNVLMEQFRKVVTQRRRSNSQKSFL